MKFSSKYQLWEGDYHVGGVSYELSNQLVETIHFSNPDQSSNLDPVQPTCQVRPLNFGRGNFLRQFNFRLKHQRQVIISANLRMQTPIGYTSFKEHYLFSVHLSRYQPIGYTSFKAHYLFSVRLSRYQPTLEKISLVLFVCFSDAN